MPPEDRINSIILLKHALEKIPPILDALNGCRSNLLKAIQEALNYITQMTVVMCGSKNRHGNRIDQSSHE
jgi:hypothetical protein